MRGRSGFERGAWLEVRRLERELQLLSADHERLKVVHERLVGVAFYTVDQLERHRWWVPFAADRLIRNLRSVLPSDEKGQP